MKISELSIEGSYLIEPQIFGDSRGKFLEAFRSDLLQEYLGHNFVVRQMNTSLSHRGVLRGIHYADVPPGQAKYVSVLSGSIIDYIVDIRVGSPTFGLWEAVNLDSISRRAVYIPEGFGHAFLSLEDDTVVNYLVSDVYKPEKEHGINPFDKSLGITFPFDQSELILSEKDILSPSLNQAKEQHLLPDYGSTIDFKKILEGLKS